MHAPEAPALPQLQLAVFDESMGRGGGCIHSCLHPPKVVWSCLMESSGRAVIWAWVHMETAFLLLCYLEVWRSPPSYSCPLAHAGL